MRQYLVALLWEASNRQQKRVPRLTEYVQMRRHTGAVLPSFTLTDLVGGGFPGAVDRVRPAVARLDLLAADLVCWCNDVFSYGKERGHGGHNLAAVIVADTGCAEDAALAEAAARFNAGLATYAGSRPRCCATPIRRWRGWCRRGGTGCAARTTGR